MKLGTTYKNRKRRVRDTTDFSSCEICEVCYEQKQGGKFVCVKLSIFHTEEKFEKIPTHISVGKDESETRPVSLRVKYARFVTSKRKEAKTSV